MSTDKNNENNISMERKTSLKNENKYPSTEKNSRLSTSKYTPISKNADADLSVVDQWCEVRAKNVPERRSFHCSWNYNDHIYLFGGVNLKSGKNSEFYKINLSQPTPSWVKFLPKGAELIEPLAYCAYANFENEFYIIGGQDATLKQVNSIYKITPNVEDVNTLNSSSNKKDLPIDEQDKAVNTNDILSKIEVSNAPALDSHCCASYQDGILFFGGFSEGVYQNKLYLYDVKNKKVVLKNEGGSNGPKPRIGAACAIYLNNFYLFGGQCKEGKFLNDMWIYSLDTNKWEEVIVKIPDGSDPYYVIPSGRSGHSINLYNNEFYIFGGRTNNVMEVNELWKFNPKTKTYELMQESLIEQYDPYTEVETKKEGKKQGTLSFKNTSKSVKNLNEVKKKKTNIVTNEEYEESMHKCCPPLSVMKSSLIFGMDTENIHWKRMMHTLTTKSIQNSYVSIIGNIPTPRDGHSSIIFKNFMVVFGGDRNKFPMNDLYTFIL